ncbi:hypothetical protein ACFOPN_15080 [Xanthomonas hyacinthi]|uniref:hypothetical protein n=1 Tax=Xanthomonas hyacinthi TaxID=56455 RepID=UPI001FCB1EAD|nr:hypothetical protein [Xanthomonas hyacinthi]
MTESLAHYIGGRRVDFRNGDYAEVFDPASGAVARRVPLGDAHAVEIAAAAAARTGAVPLPRTARTACRHPGPLHVHGPDGVRFYTRLKTVTARWPAAARGAEFAMPTMR